MNEYRFDVTPYFEEQRFYLVQIVRIDKLPVIKPQTSPEVVHEHGEAGHNSKYTPWTTKFITVMRYETAERTREGVSNTRVMFVEFPVHSFTLVGDFDEAFFSGWIGRPLTHCSRSIHGGRCSGGGEEE